MVPEKRIKIAKILSLVVIIGGIAAMLGDMFDITIFKSISSQWRSVRFITAVGFILSGITLYFIIHALEGRFDTAQVVLSITSFTLVLFMGVSFFSTVLGLTGVEGLLVKSSPTEVNRVILGRPAMLAILNFLLIAAAAILVTWKVEKLQTKLKIIGLIITLIGATSLAGYIINVPFLYNFLQGTGSAMACPTAILFVLSGIALLCL
jgi:hypothetical protein